jgi:hypothetical protein
MSELIEDIKEDIKREDLLRLWRQYGNWLIMAIVAFVLGTSGFFYWQHRQEEKKRAQAQAFEVVLQGLDSHSKEASLKLLQDFSQSASGGYKMMAEFMAAGFSAQRVDALKKLSQESKQEKTFKDMALILSALNQLDGPDPREVLETLSVFEASASPFRPLAQELRAHAYLRGGESQKAFEIFKALAQDQLATEAIQNRSEAMIHFIQGAHS